MARYVDDLQLLLPIFAQPDPTSDPDVAPHRRRAGQPRRACASRSSTRTASARSTRDPRGGARAPARALADAGHEVVEERPPNQAEVREVFEQIALAEIGVAAVAR